MIRAELNRRVKAKQPTSAQHFCEHLEDCWKTIPGGSIDYFHKKNSKYLKMYYGGNICI